eukprot:TRINITY_DN1021_c0_g1_i1.p2 TRINITY_DN1021_c0_g1~~TRINITY_DN1021_c0_g1_i1.p2  ORF type:complete len:480 (+),score=98.08 TRINITY_DN1021_c0_g1_i1:95-1441(+)
MSEKQQKVATNVGIVALEVYFPRMYVPQSDMEKYLQVPQGKITVGLGQTRMAFVDEREDIYSLSLNALTNLLEKYRIDPKSIGRLECASETILDHSKSIKTHLLPLFAKAGNHEIEGVDSLNACYGGTAALLNSIAWCQSSAWDGRYAVVVSADIAEYAIGPALPTGGAGAVAMLIGPDAPLVMEPLRASYMDHVYDFYKPDLSSPFPVVFGQFSNACYLKSLDNCYNSLKAKYKAQFNRDFSLEDIDHTIFHCPYAKLVQKAFARLRFIDFMEKSKDLDLSTDREVLFNSFMKNSGPVYQGATDPTSLLGKLIGNTYTASVYMGLVSLIHSAGTALSGKRILMFSYGSGCASTLFTLKVPSSKTAMNSIAKIQRTIRLRERLDSCVSRAVDDLIKCTKQRMGYKFGQDYFPKGPENSVPLAPGTHYLVKIDASGRRTHARIPISSKL